MYMHFHYCVACNRVCQDDTCEYVEDYDGYLCLSCLDNPPVVIPNPEELEWVPDREYQAGYAYACGYQD